MNTISSVWETRCTKTLLLDLPHCVVLLRKVFKLVHLTAALRGNAKSFYRSCTAAKKTSYTQLVSALKKRFVPVKLTALQTQMFHSRRPGTNESFDDFAQELRPMLVYVREF